MELGFSDFWVSPEGELYAHSPGANYRDARQRIDPEFLDMLEEKAAPKEGLDLPHAEALEAVFLYWLTDYEMTITRRWAGLRVSEMDVLAQAQFMVFLKMLTEYIEYEAAKL